MTRAIGVYAPTRCKCGGSHFSDGPVDRITGDYKCLYCGRLMRGAFVFPDPREEKRQQIHARVDSLRKGQKFVCVQGQHWTYVRPDGALSGVHHVERDDGQKNMFAGCAEVRVQS